MTACSSLKVIQKDFSPVAPLKSTEVILFADPQLHNMTGSALKQMLPISDLFSRVALRPPELNVIADHAMEAALKRVATKGSDLALMLGDATNIACSGELERFERIMNRVFPRDQDLWMMVHGNHDSYLMGTTNGYLVDDDSVLRQRERRGGSAFWPPVVANNGLPVYDNWWDLEAIPHGDTSWGDACYRADSDNTPINKVQWLAKYIKHLNAYSAVNIKGVLDETNSSSDVNVYRLSNESEAIREGQYFGLKGTWYEPIFTQDALEEKRGRLPSQTKMFAPFLSYIVQSIDIDQHTNLILIDTSVCKKARGGVYFLIENASRKPCIGHSQLRDIEHFLSRAQSSGKQVVLGGHFPLDSLKQSERSKLERLMNRYASDWEEGWLYLSAHKHKSAKTIRHEGGKELNIGSITDWPMQHIGLRFGGNGAWDWQTRFIDEPLLERSNSYDDIHYKVESAAFFEASVPELCRHVSTACALANLDQLWESPEHDKPCVKDIARFAELEKPSVNPWRFYGEKLDACLTMIDARIKDLNGAEYLSQLMKIMATASRAESRTFQLLP